jgi:acyl-CoA synthetase (AMP-forming)/AMP-acid ligase II
MKTVEEYGSVWHAFNDAVARFGPRPFLRTPASSAAAYADGAIEFGYRQAMNRARELIAGYDALGIAAGDRVAVAFDSRLEVYLHLLALNALGAGIVPLNCASTDAELLHVVGHSDSRLIVGLPEYRERLAGLNACPVITEAGLPVADLQATVADPDPAREAALLYTSGTTGKPKGCMLSNAYFLALGVWYNSLGGICSLDEHDRLLTPLPPNHMNALCTSFPAMMLAGGCVIQVDRFHPRSWWTTVREERATVIHCLGVMTAILLSLPEAATDDLSGQIKFCFGPGSDPRHQGVFERRFGFPLIEAWAMTESGAGGMTIAYEEPRHVGSRCIGRPVETTEYRIVDESDRDVTAGEPGELLVRARGDDPRRGFFSGYYKDEAATEEGWKGGWWHTGDVVRAGDDGSLYFVDRRKNVIRRSGENIAAVEVEAVLLQHPDVLGCAVCAVPDELRGDEVFAFVISRGADDARDIFEHCMAQLTYFKVPGYIAFVPDLPLTASQKVSRGEIRRLARDILANGHCADLRDFKKRQKTG